MIRALNFHVIWELFLTASRVQRKRAMLTILAIAWGTFTLLMLLAFGEGLTRQMMIAKSGMGTDLAVVWIGETGKAWQGLPVGRPLRARYRDLEILKGRIPGCANVIGELTSWSVSLSNGLKTVNGRVTGTDPEYGEVRNHIPQAGGRFFDDLDMADRRRVIFLGDALARNIYGQEDPVGRSLLVNKVPYTVIGVMKKKMQMGTYKGPDEEGAVIPATTFIGQFGSERLNNFLLKPERPELMKNVIQGMKETWSPVLGFDPTDERAFGIWNTVESNKMLSNMMLGIEGFLGLIGALTLITGGIGVANIMFAVVNERTREIGVKMALGARRSWITGPLILEGLLFTTFGGVIGLILSLGAVVGIGFLPLEGNEALEYLRKPVLSPAIGLGAALILGLIGLLAGYFPARRAAAINPAQTLRYE